ncbi:1-(5-phosphoribosyl)-5-[(5-phosphoribosylamino)methylideneamino]imidazole-4-carboxamide isomerase [Candidatus Marinamargulisbacteria bacterium SCGC AAA071-K20]|nr:1-(5-phosphoribosyl)-5-[(5-phosphoribosylamino)methylideneamino]imidazole-4-carboxamide isomerase [Candidatus Marinamargulisbacteria bacterium SCGC AAA071-K20]
MFNIIPAIDLLDGKVVRLTQGKYDQVDTYDISPEALVEKYEAAGAKRIHVVDLNGAKDGKLTNAKVIQSIRNQSSVEIECGGGIRNQESVQSLLDLGINYIILGSLLTKDFEKASQLITTFPGKIIAGIDTVDGNVAVEGWIENSGISEDALLSKLNDLPLESVIYTDIKKDGMMMGPNVESLIQFASLSKHPIIASGGVSTLEDIALLKENESKGISGCIIGKAILSNSIDINLIFS